MSSSYPIWVGSRPRIDHAAEANLNCFTWTERGTVAEVELCGAVPADTLREFAGCLDLAREQDGIRAATVDLCVVGTNFHGVVDAVRALRRFGEVKQLVCHATGYAIGGGYLLWIAGNDRTSSGLTQIGNLSCVFDGTWSPAKGPLVSLAEHQQTMLELAYEILPNANHKAVADRHGMAEELEARGVVDILWQPQPGVAASILRASHAKQEKT
jgi:hypothetical protein